MSDLDEAHKIARVFFKVYRHPLCPNFETFMAMNLPACMAEQLIAEELGLA